MSSRYRVILLSISAAVYLVLLLSAPPVRSQNTPYIESYFTTMSRPCGTPGSTPCYSDNCSTWCSPPHNRYDTNGCPADRTGDGWISNTPIWDWTVPGEYCALQKPTASFFPVELTLTHPPDYTFYVTTDLHFGADYFLGSVHDEDHARHTRELQGFGGKNNWPAGAGFDQTQLIDEPEAVIVSGDLTHDGLPSEFQTFRLLWETGLSTDSINLPVAPGYGNHDMDDTCAANNCAKRLWNYFDQILNAGNVNYDSESHNYSWDWGSLHVVQLNAWAGDTTLGDSLHGSGFSWFVDDLAKVGTQRPIVIVQHFGLDPLSMFGSKTTIPVGWWNSTEWDDLGLPKTTTTFTNVKAFLKAIQGYNVVAMFTGHRHSTGAIYTTLPNGQLLDDLIGGTGGIDQCGGNWQEYPDCGGRGDFFVVRYRDYDAPPNGSLNGSGAKYLEVASVEWKNNYGNPQDNPPPYFTNFSNMSSEFSHVGAQGPPYAAQSQGCRKLVSNNLIDYSSQVIISPPSDGWVTVTNISPSVISGDRLKNPLVLEINGMDINGGSGYTTAPLDLGGTGGEATNASGESFVDRCAGTELVQTQTFPYFAYSSRYSRQQSGQTTTGLNVPQNTDGTYSMDAPNVYLISDAVVFRPGNSMKFHLGFPVGANPTLRFLSVGRDMLVPQTGNVSLSKSRRTAIVPLSLLSGKAETISAVSNSSWLIVKLSSATTPARLTLETAFDPPAGSVASVQLDLSNHAVTTQHIIVTFGGNANAATEPGSLPPTLNAQIPHSPEMSTILPTARENLPAAAD
ncbi:hypothetical protein DYQ86_24975 [Acidobacteria bacterium AB60]|nr:hypothetical protein DYQ86_24975 [Acidobacteria bacterium AB60]